MVKWSCFHKRAEEQRHKNKKENDGFGKISIGILEGKASYSKQNKFNHTKPSPYLYKQRILFHLFCSMGDGWMQRAAGWGRKGEQPGNQTDTIETENSLFRSSSTKKGRHHMKIRPETELLSKGAVAAHTIISQRCFVGQLCVRKKDLIADNGFILWNVHLFFLHRSTRTHTCTRKRTHTQQKQQRGLQYICHTAGTNSEAPQDSSSCCGAWLEVCLWPFVSSALSFTTLFQFTQIQDNTKKGSVSTPTVLWSAG